MIWFGSVGSIFILILILSFHLEDGKDLLAKVTSVCRQHPFFPLRTDLLKMVSPKTVSMRTGVVSWKIDFNR